MKLGRKFFERDTKRVAIDLLGKLLVHETKAGFCIGKVVETEAYFGLNDPGSHACNGPTPRSRIMFGPPGRAYVYFTY
ncbi:MAG: DNA-3-methyladenine glycosylase, partial [Candidatus Aenigmatarchaeota archaeon]